MASKCVGKQATSESTDCHSAGERGGTKNNQASSSKPRLLTTHSSVPGSSSGAAGGSGQDPNKPRQGVSHLAMVMTSLLMTHTRLYLLRMPSLFLSFQDRISKGLTRVTFYQQRSLHFEESTTTSQAISGPAKLVRLPGITLWIIKGMWPQDSTLV